MKGHFITSELIDEFKQFLIIEEKSPATIEKYIRDILAFTMYLAQQEVTKQVFCPEEKELTKAEYERLSCILGFILLYGRCVSRSDCHLEQSFQKSRRAEK